FDSFAQKNAADNPEWDLVEADLHYSSTGDPVRKGPYLIYNGKNTAMTVTWQTAATPKKATIQWGPTASYGSGPIEVKENGNGEDQHQFFYPITGLTPGAQVYYRVTVDNFNYDRVFTAGPPDGATELSFYSYGDSRSLVGQRGVALNQVNAALLNDMAKLPGTRQTMLVHSGDYALIGTWEDIWDWDLFGPSKTNTESVLGKLPWLTVLGNHEGYMGPDLFVDAAHFGDVFRKYFPYDRYLDPRHFYYSTDYGPAHFAIVDTWTYDPAIWNSSNPKIDAAQLDWLKQDLQASSKPWKIVSLHYPIWDCQTDNEEIQIQLCPIIEKSGIKLVIQGHNHYYCRSEVNGVTYLTLGGGGAELDNPTPVRPLSYVKTYKEAHHFARCDIKGNTMAVTVIDDTGAVIDSFTINK
ncbi:MAG: metallophosphoesterase family protein, partial [Deltaproteobacteria bacterium]|nr:metallophosphoesterase family protein [Deltaproteobacteria bacterium]